MINGIMSAINRLINSTQSIGGNSSVQQHQTTVIDNKKWMYCVVLAKCGWETYNCKTIPTKLTEQKYQQEERVFVTKWRKEGEEDIEISLTFAEQRLWLGYLLREGE